jgi:hypothetical protein
VVQESATLRDHTLGLDERFKAVTPAMLAQ